MADVKELKIDSNTYDIKAKSVVDQNTGKLKFWSGTKAEYDALGTKDANTLYNITDDTDTSLNLLQTIYPVGSLYLTTNSVCPLANLFGTWTLVSQDRVLQGAGSRGAVGTTINESLPNITGQTPQLATHMNQASLDLLSGAFTISDDKPIKRGWSGADADEFKSYEFNANKVSSTYKDNAPVQQNAYLINVYRRIV